MAEIKINKKKYKVKEGERVIDTCRKYKIEVASLCDHEDFGPFNERITTDKAVCRLCMVKFKKRGDAEFQLSSSCMLRAEDGMEVMTEDAEIDRLRRTNLELLFADHAGLCPTCVRNGDCELQNLAIKYDIEEYRFVPKLNEISDSQELDLLYEKMERRMIDKTNPCIQRDSMKCIKCRRCVRVCRDFQTVESYAPTGKGYEVSVGTEYNTPLECTYCGQCTAVCPTAALVEKNEIGDFLKALKDRDKMVIVQTAPSVRISLGEEFGMAPGAIVTGKMVRALRDLGADLVFDTNFAADLTIMEESAELLRRLNGKEGTLPLFTSCCPAWVLFLEQHYPELLKQLSTCRSPQMMMGSMVKNYWAAKNGIDPKNIYVVSIMPCIAKKYEIQRPEFKKRGVQDVDCVLTTRELGRLLRSRRVDLMELEDSDFDPVLGISTGAGAIFAASGGVTEAALRTAYYMITGKNTPRIALKEVRGTAGIREADFVIGGKKLKTKVVHGLGNARSVLEELKRGEADFDLLEVMACPDGCIGGGGQPVPTNAQIRKARIKAVFGNEEKLPLRRSHENPMIKKLYEDFLVEPGSRKAENFLHTNYYKYRYKYR